MRFKAVLVLISGLSACNYPLVGATPSLPRLPQIDMSNYLPAIQQQIERAYEAARANPKNASANGELGMMLDGYEQYESAAVCYQRAHLLVPGSFRWLYYLGWVQAAQGKYQDAVTTIRDALEIRPDYLPAQLKLAESMLAAGRWEESGMAYEEILKKHPDCAAAHYGLGRVYSARGNAAAAAASYLQACELFPPYGAAHYSLALVYRKLGLIDKSRQHLKLYDQNRMAVPPLDDPLRNAVAELNLGPLSHVRRGIALEQAGEIREAIAEHEKALQIDPKHVQAHINLISLYGRLGEVTKAEEHYRAAVSLNPNQADAHYNYGVLRMRQKRYAEAEPAFRRALEINPSHAEAHHNLGYLFEQQARTDEAFHEYQQAIASQPNYRLAHFHIGRILVNQNKYDESIQHFLKTLEPEDENTPGYLYALAAAYARAGNREAALKYARKAREEAAARGQTQLLLSIERDLYNLEKTVTSDK